MVISNYYSSLDRTQKGEFVKWVMQRCGISYITVMQKVKEDRWTKLEREVVEEYIQNQDGKS